MLLVQGSSRLGYLSARSPTAMMRLLLSPASISLRPTDAVSHCQHMPQCMVLVMQAFTGMNPNPLASTWKPTWIAAFLELAVLGQVDEL